MTNPRHGTIPAESKVVMLSPTRSVIGEPLRVIAPASSRIGGSCETSSVTWLGPDATGSTVAASQSDSNAPTSAVTRARTAARGRGTAREYRPVLGAGVASSVSEERREPAAPKLWTETVCGPASACPPAPSMVPAISRTGGRWSTSKSTAFGPRTSPVNDASSQSPTNPTWATTSARTVPRGSRWSIE